MPNTLSAKHRAKKIKLLLFDVDGVLTDGKIFVFPAPAGASQTVLDHAAQHGGVGGFGLQSQTLIEAKGFHAHDGTAISLARLAGIKTGLITKRVSETVALRARENPWLRSVSGSEVRSRPLHRAAQRGPRRFA